MPNPMKSKSKSNNSTLTLPSFHETELQLRQATSMPEISNVLITLCEQLGNKTELHVHFIVNSIVVGRDANGSAMNIGNNNNVGIQNDKDVVIQTTGNGNNFHSLGDLTKIGHTTYGNDSDITGQIENVSDVHNSHLQAVNVKSDGALNSQYHSSGNRLTEHKDDALFLEEQKKQILKTEETIKKLKKLTA